MRNAQRRKLLALRHKVLNARPGCEALQLRAVIWGVSLGEEDAELADAALSALPHDSGRRTPTPFDGVDEAPHLLALGRNLEDDALRPECDQRVTVGTAAHAARVVRVE